MSSEVVNVIVTASLSTLGAFAVLKWRVAELEKNRIDDKKDREKEMSALKLQVLEENKNQWAIISKIREAATAHDKEAGFHRLEYEKRLGAMTLQIAQNEAAVKAVSDKVESIDKKLDKLFDRLDDFINRSIK